MAAPVRAGGSGVPIDFTPTRRQRELRLAARELAQRVLTQ